MAVDVTRFDSISSSKKKIFLALCGAFSRFVSPAKFTVECRNRSRNMFERSGVLERNFLLLEKKVLYISEATCMLIESRQDNKIGWTRVDEICEKLIKKRM